MVNGGKEYDAQVENSKVIKNDRFGHVEVQRKTVAATIDRFS
jgi:hypothetical protein